MNFLGKSLNIGDVQINGRVVLSCGQKTTFLSYRGLVLSLSGYCYVRGMERCCLQCFLGERGQKAHTFKRRKGIGFISTSFKIFLICFQEERDIDLPAIDDRLRKFHHQQQSKQSIEKRNSLVKNICGIFLGTSPTPSISEASPERCLQIFSMV